MSIIPTQKQILTGTQVTLGIQQQLHFINVMLIYVYWSYIYAKKLNIFATID